MFSKHPMSGNGSFQIIHIFSFFFTIWSQVFSSLRLHIATILVNSPKANFKPWGEDVAFKAILSVCRSRRGNRTISFCIVKSNYIDHLQRW